MRTIQFAILAAMLVGPTPRFVSGQSISLGVKAGGSLTDGFTSVTAPAGPVSITGYSRSKDYIVGPTLELRLIPHWTFEVDALYRKLNFTTASVLTNGSLVSVSPSPVITWEFPVLAKYTFDLWKLKPLVEAGPSFRTAGNLNGTNPSHVGATAGVGVQLHTRRLSVEPVLRYTRWRADGISPFPARSRSDQLELLVGFGVAPETKWRPFGDRFSLGVVAGESLTEDLAAENFSVGSVLSTTSRPERSFLVGPSAEYHLKNHWLLETEAVYHPLRAEFVTTFNGAAGKPFGGSTATWEIPLLAKYRFSNHIVSPFAEGGPSFRLPAANLSNFGVTAGIGVETHFRLLRVSPMVRYTHWDRNCLSATPAQPNQVQFLVRFST